MTQKILYLSPYFWPEDVGSAPYCTDVALHLRSRGHDVAVEAFRPHYPDEAQFAAWSGGARDKEIHDGLAISRVVAQARGTGGFSTRIRNDLYYLFHVLRRSFTQAFRGTDVVVAYVPSILTLHAAFAVRLFTGARIIAVVHDIESGLASSLGITRSRLILRIMQWVERVGLNRADHIIVLTTGMEDELRKLGCRRPISVLPIWAAVAPWQEPPAETTQIVTYSGNFGKKQNLDQILPLLERMASADVGIKVILRGEGSERARIAEEVRRRAIANVEFLPFAPAEAFMASLQAANIHLVPQARNVANYALPSKLVSIMSAGRPFICIADPDSPLDLLAKESGGGYCVAPGHEDMLFQTVAALAQDRPLQARMGRKGQAYVALHMDRDHILSRYMDIVCPPQTALSGQTQDGKHPR